MEKKILQGGVGFIITVLVLAFLFAGEKKVYSLYDRSFAAQQSTTLFFKNTRAFYYALEELPEAKMNVYRFGETTKSDTGIYLNFILVHNWMTDEVFVITEPSAALLALGEVAIQIGDSTHMFNKTTMNNEAQYDFAARVFEALLADKPVTLVAQKQNLFGTADNQIANQQVLEDYFRWVYKYR
jgi:hypothetical protein